MGFYKNSDDFYGAAQAMFTRLQDENPDAAQAVNGARLLIRLRCTDPTAEVFINGRRNPVAISYGPVKERPELEIAMEADTLHRILLGDLTLPDALGAKMLKVRGPVWKTVVLADLFFQSQQYYPEILVEQGLMPADY
jgi:hypothetical protein